MGKITRNELSNGLKSEFDKVDVLREDLGGTGRTTETIKGNKDDLEAHKIGIATEENLGHIRVETNLKGGIKRLGEVRGIEGNYYEVIAGNQTLYTVDKSLHYGGNANSLVVSGDYIYKSGTTDGVQKINKSNLTRVANSTTYVSQALVVDDNNIYIDDRNSENKVHMLDKSNLNVITSSPPYGGYITAMVGDSNYIYGFGYSTNNIWKLDKLSLTKVAESTSLNGIQSLCSSGDYIYAGGSSKTIKKIRKSDLVQVAESSVLNEISTKIIADTEFVYAMTSNILYKIEKSNLVHKAAGGAFPSYRDVVQSQDSLYIISDKGSGDCRIYKTDKQSLNEFQAESEVVNLFRGLDVDDGFIYSDQGSRIFKMVNILKIEGLRRVE